MIVAQNLTKCFDGFVALNALSCTIARGCIYGLVGSNGAGKSTLLRLLAGIYRPDAGSVTLEGAPIYENPEVKGRLVFVPDDWFFLGGASLRRMEALYRAAYARFDVERYRRLVDAFRLDENKPLASFSKGMRRQAATILAISCRPDYLFLDETFDGLDPVMRHLVKGLICEDVLERQATAILSSHSLRELEDTCDQLALLHQGGLVFESDIQNLKTSLFKIQIAFLDDYDKSRFAELPLVHFSKKGSVAAFIVRGDRDEVTEKLRAMQPAVLDILPLTLEEVFTFEMEALGYSFGDVLMNDMQRSRP